MRTGSASSIIVGNLTCEYLSNPIGIETPRPRLSWQLRSHRRAQMQKAWQVQAASTREALLAGKADLWDSRKVASDKSVHVPYAGKTLKSRQGCWWQVRVWDADGKASRYSEPAYFEMGLLKSGHWRAKWITSPAAAEVLLNERSSPILRKAFPLDKPVASARAYVCGLGYFEMHINGKRVGQNVLDPGVTKFDTRTLYVTHDVTDQLRSGDNVVAVSLGNGWYNCQTPVAWDFHKAAWRDRPKLLLQLHVTFVDGTTTTILSDTTWRASMGPIVFDALRNGETYDARMEKPGWTDVGYDDSEGWHGAMLIAGPGGVLHAQQHTPIRATATIAPVSVREVKSGVFVFDMGETFSGWSRLTVTGPSGTTVTLRHAEKVLEDGDIDQRNINPHITGGDCQTDRYILKGDGVETFEPRFTYHGFRYVQVTGFPGTPTLDSLRGRMVHTDFQRRGQFECSSGLFNRIHKAVIWSTLSNYHGIPTDCPHREKNGWTGDAHLSAEQLLYNFRGETAYTKWMDDFADAQRPSGQLPGIVPTSGWGYNWGSGPAWDVAFILIPWYMYQYGGDLAVLQRHYEGMKQYVDFVGTIADSHIVDFGLGDWCPPLGPCDTPPVPVAMTSTSYYFVAARMVSRIASLLGKSADARKLAALAEDIRQAWLAKYYDDATARVDNNCQTALSCALYQELLPAEDRPRVLENLVKEVQRCNGHIDCGILGTKYVMHVLTDGGRADVAWSIASREDFPSWGDMLNKGATTLWETWDGTSSRCHHMFSDVGAWFYKALGGISPQEPGFKRVTIRPWIVGDMKWVRASHEGPHGTIECHWRRQGRKLTLEVAVPTNSQATVYIPTVDKAGITESGKPLGRAKGVKVLRQEGNFTVLDVGSGEYVFEVKDLAI